MRPIEIKDRSFQCKSHSFFFRFEHFDSIFLDFLCNKTELTEDEKKSSETALQLTAHQEIIDVLAMSEAQTLFTDENSQD